MYLFVIYGVFILILLGIFFTFTYTHYRRNTLRDASKELENMCASVENSVATQLDAISTISMNIVYSNAIKKNFKEFATYQQDVSNPEYLVASREKAMAIHDIVTAIIGAYQSAAEINLFTMDGSCVEAGYGMRTSTVALDEQYWYDEVMDLNGHKYLSLPIVHKNLPAKAENQRTRKFISLIRLFLNSDNQPEGIVEVVQDCAQIFSLASQLEYQNPDSRVYVYNSRQELVYPYNFETAPANYPGMIREAGLAENSPGFVSDATNNALLLTHQIIPEYNWTVVITKPQAAVYQPLNNYRIVFLAIAALSILFTLFICFFISQRLTQPLQKLTAATSKITINRVLDEKKVNLTSADSRIAELSQLCESIRDMYEKLRSTSQDVLLSRSEETRAKLQATQSLINPHFLYNCLTNISIMAEEEMNEDIIHMCQALCDYFRYISSSKEMVVTLEEELFFAKQYLDCMKLRFDDELEYQIDIAPGTGNLYIPKLITQPVIENAFKYAFDKIPPWRLKISSELEHSCWVLRIEDNGGALSDEKKQELMHLYRNLNMNEELKSLQIGGMGLKNTYLRLKLLYGEQAIFRIENTLPQRTIFILGGPIYHTREEYYEQHPQL